MNGANGNHDADMLARVRRRRERHHGWLREGDPTVVRQLARVGVLGWLIVTPALLGAWVGHALDVRAGSGIFWSAPLILLGLGIGCWIGWKWMHTP